MIDDDECRGGRFNFDDLPASVQEEWRRRANARRRSYRGYRPPPLGSLGNPIGKLGGEPMDGIDYVSDDLRDLRIAGAMQMDWTPEEDARAEASAEQIAAAMHEAQRHDDRARFPAINRDAVKVKVRNTLDAARAVRALGPHSETFIDPQIPASLTASAGASCAEVVTIPQPFDPDDPESYRGLFGVVAGKPNEVHVLRGGYTPERWVLKEIGGGVGCQWCGPGCFDYTRTGLTFSCGQWLILIPTCQACGEALMAREPARV